MKVVSKTVLLLVLTFTGTKGTIRPAGRSKYGIGGGGISWGGKPWGGGGRRLLGGNGNGGGGPIWGGIGGGGCVMSQLDGGARCW